MTNQILKGSHFNIINNLTFSHYRNDKVCEQNLLLLHLRKKFLTLNEDFKLMLRQAGAELGQAQPPLG